jgi:hypothetical protein
MRVPGFPRSADWHEPDTGKSSSEDGYLAFIRLDRFFSTGCFLAFIID